MDTRKSKIECKSEINKCKIDVTKEEITTTRSEIDRTKVQKKTCDVSNQHILHMHADICAQAKLVKQEVKLNNVYVHRHNLYTTRCQIEVMRTVRPS